MTQTAQVAEHRTGAIEGTLDTASLAKLQRPSPDEPPEIRPKLTKMKKLLTALTDFVYYGANTPNETSN